jgi:hypothetical protein
MAAACPPMIAAPGRVGLLDRLAARMPSIMPPMATIEAFCCGCDAARDVPLRDMAEFMRQHRGQFVGRGRQRDQAQVHAHVAARQRKGIDAAVAHQERLPGEGAIDLAVDVADLACPRHQRVPQRLQVLLQHGVVQEGRVAPTFAHDLVAQAAFGTDAQIGRGRLAQRRQAHLGLHGQARQRHQDGHGACAQAAPGCGGWSGQGLLGWLWAGLEPRRGVAFPCGYDDTAMLLKVAAP